MTLSPFPPSFEGNPWSYGSALFALTLLSSLSLAQILTIANDAARPRHAAAKLGVSHYREPAPRFWTPLMIYRWQVICFCLTIFSGAIGDVLVMLAWGEATAHTMFVLFALDRALDSFTIVPFTGAMALGMWSSQAIPHALEYPRPMPVRPPRWHVLRRSVRLVIIILFIAAGVTLGKAQL